MLKNFNDIMFKNPGVKIKIIAQVIAWIEIFCSILGGLFLFFAAFEDLECNWWFILVSPTVIIFGILTAWISSIMLYGFGELVDNSKKDIGYNDEDSLTSSDYNVQYESDGGSIVVTCPECGGKMSFSGACEEIECPWCGTDLKLKEVDDINENTL